MDANVYKEWLKEVKKAFFQVDHRINVFGPAEDKGTYKDYLEESWKLLMKPKMLPFTCAAS